MEGKDFKEPSFQEIFSKFSYLVPRQEKIDIDNKLPFKLLKTDKEGYMKVFREFFSRKDPRIKRFDIIPPSIYKIFLDEIDDYIIGCSCIFNDEGYVNVELVARHTKDEYGLEKIVTEKNFNCSTDCYIYQTQIVTDPFLAESQTHTEHVSMIGSDKAASFLADEIFDNPDLFVED